MPPTTPIGKASDNAVARGVVNAVPLTPLPLTRVEKVVGTERDKPVGGDIRDDSPLTAVGEDIEEAVGRENERPVGKFVGEGIEKVGWENDRPDARFVGRGIEKAG
jgi:hypothetical protein